MSLVSETIKYARLTWDLRAFLHNTITLEQSKQVLSTRLQNRVVQIFIPYPGIELFDLSVQHELQTPQTLEGWVSSSWVNRRLDYPWLTPERKSMLKMLSLCSYFIAKDNPTRFSDVSRSITFLANLYRPIAVIRMRDLHYRFFSELKVVELLGFRSY